MAGCTKRSRFPVFILGFLIPAACQHSINFAGSDRSNMDWAVVPRFKSDSFPDCVTCSTVSEVGGGNSTRKFWNRTGLNAKHAADGVYIGVDNRTMWTTFQDVVEYISQSWFADMTYYRTCEALTSREASAQRLAKTPPQQQYHHHQQTNNDSAAIPAPAATAQSKQLPSTAERAASAVLEASSSPPQSVVGGGDSEKTNGADSARWAGQSLWILALILAMAQPLAFAAALTVD